MREHQSDAINELAAALAKAQAEMTHAVKSTVNPHFKSRYADLAAIMAAARPVLAQNGLSVFQITDTDEAGRVLLVSQLTHASGQWVRSWYPVSPVKNDPQGMGSAITYAKRYSYAALVGIAAEDEDDDGNAASDRGEAAKAPSIFDTPEARERFTNEAIDAAKKATDLQGLKAVRQGNLARLNAMIASPNGDDVTAFDRFAAAYNTQFTKFKEQEQEPKPVSPATVEVARQKVKLPPSVEADEVPF